MKKLLLIWMGIMGLFLLVNAAYANCGQHGGRLSVENAWIREAPSVVKVMAGFMNISNPTNKTAVLLGAESSLFEKVELHRSIVENGVAKMKLQKKIEIPAGSEIDFSPGGLHLMLINPRQSLKVDDTVTINLKFEGGDDSPVVFTVRSVDAVVHH